MRFLSVLVLKGIRSLIHSKREMTENEEVGPAERESSSAAGLV